MSSDQVALRNLSDLRILADAWAKDYHDSGCGESWDIPIQITTLGEKILIVAKRGDHDDILFEQWIEDGKLKQRFAEGVAKQEGEFVHLLYCHAELPLPKGMEC